MSHCADIFCRNKDVCTAYRLIAQELSYEWTLLTGIQDNDDAFGLAQDEPWYKEQWRIFRNRSRHILRTVRRRYLDDVVTNAGRLYNEHDDDNQARFVNPFGTRDGKPFCESQRETARGVIWDLAEVLTRANIDFRAYWSNDNDDFRDKSDDYASLEFDDAFLAREAERRRQRELQRPPLRDLTNVPRGDAAMQRGQPDRQPDW